MEIMEQEVSTITDNLVFLMNEKGVNAYDISRATGIPQPSIYRIVRGITANPRAENIDALAHFFNVEPSALMFENLRLSKDAHRIDKSELFVLIPMYSATAACGIGYENEQIPELEAFPFPQKWLNDLGIHRKDSACITADGESMLPTINDQAVVMIDISSREKLEGKVFAVCRNGHAIIKRLQIDREGNWYYSSDNPNKNLFPDQFPLDDDFIIGRVVWQGGHQGL